MAFLRETAPETAKNGAGQKRLVPLFAASQGIGLPEAAAAV
ncbi:MAG: hypothetical protein ACLS4Z_05330 [Christensenellaceae bacterium]